MPRIPRILAFALLLLLASLPVVGAGHSAAVVSRDGAVVAPAADVQQAGVTGTSEAQASETSDLGVPSSGDGRGIALAPWLLVSLLAASGGALITLGVLLSHKLRSFSSACAEPGSKWFG